MMMIVVVLFVAVRSSSGRGLKLGVHPAEDCWCRFNPFSPLQNCLQLLQCMYPVISASSLWKALMCCTSVDGVANCLEHNRHGTLLFRSVDVNCVSCSSSPRMSSYT